MKLEKCIQLLMFVLVWVLTSTLMTNLEPAQADDSGLASALHTLARERGKICMVGHFHSGTSSDKKSKRIARKAAIKSWEEFTDWEYGSDWAKFSRSRNQGKKCSKSGKTWRCSVEARPCRRINKQYSSVK